MMPTNSDIALENLELGQNQEKVAIFNHSNPFALEHHVSASKHTTMPDFAQKIFKI